MSKKARPKLTEHGLCVHRAYSQHDFRCGYCGVDLLASFHAYTSMTLDHFVPKCLGGPNHGDNRVTACYGCNRIKSGHQFDTLEEAQQGVAELAAREREVYMALRRRYRKGVS